MTRAAIVLAAVAAALVACSHGTPSAAPAPSGAISFLSVNDVYVLDTLSDGKGGLARVAAIRNRMAAAGPTLFLLAGDVLSPSLVSKYYNGRQMVEAFNAAHLDYATFGNHEFEAARDTLVARIAESKFRWISTNCVEASGKPFPGVVPFDTVRMGGRLIGLFGLTLINDYRRYVHCGRPDSAATWAVDTLSALKVDMIVGLTHLAVGNDYLLLSSDRRIDLILGGHEHEAHDSIVGGRHVLKADANSRTAQTAVMTGSRGQWTTNARLLTIDAATPSEPSVARVIRGWNDSLARKLGPARIIGTVVTPLDGRDTPSRSRETALGDIVADAFRDGTGADVGLINSGTMRLDDVIHAGPLSNLTIESIFLFSDETRVVTFPMTGARVRELLEHGVSEGRIGAGAFPQTSGLRMQVELSRPSGQRITNLTRADGSPLAPEAIVRVAFDVYPACTGGDGYKVPEAAEACAAAATAPRGAELVVRYIEKTLIGRVDHVADGRMTITRTPQPAK